MRFLNRKRDNSLPEKQEAASISGEGVGNKLKVGAPDVL